ncbi:hypothetical protein ABPG74_017743 [Tetrahymena malaccensis]
MFYLNINVFTPQLQVIVNSFKHSIMIHKISFLVFKNLCIYFFAFIRICLRESFKHHFEFISQRLFLYFRWFYKNIHHKYSSIMIVCLLVLEHHFQILKLLFYLKTQCSSYLFEVFLDFYGISEEVQKICLKKWLIQVFFIVEVSQFYFKQSSWFQVKIINGHFIGRNSLCDLRVLYLDLLLFYQS